MLKYFRLSITTLLSGSLGWTGLATACWLEVPLIMDQRKPPWFFWRAFSKISRSLSLAWSTVNSTFSKVMASFSFPDA